MECMQLVLFSLFENSVEHLLTNVFTPMKRATYMYVLISRHISRMQSFQQNRHIIFLALVALKLLVSLIICLVACSARIVVDTQTDRQRTDRHTTVTLAAHARRGLIIQALYTTTWTLIL